MDRGRGDRPGIPGLRVATGGGDLIEDIHRQQRRRLLKRAAQLTALAIALLLIGVAFKIFKDRHARASALEAAYEHFVKSTPPEIDASVQVLQRSIDDVGGDDPSTLAARALARAHLWAEFGIGEAEARAAVEEVPAQTPGRALAQAMLVLADGDLEAARAGLDEDRALGGDEPVDPFVASERVWLEGRLVVAGSPDDPEALAAVIATLRARLEEEPMHVAVRRQLVLALLLSGDQEGALTELALAREHAPTHMGLSADDALYNAYLRQKLSGVASVADQLLSGDRPGLSRHDLAHARLARAVVHVQSGEHEEGLEMLDEAWEGLPAWDRMSRRLAIRSALEAGNAERIDEWVESTPLPEPEGDIYRAWAVLVRGDVMEALRRLAELPQADPWVGYLQALALVEQGRFEEAGPWLDRTEKLLPGRIEVEVARARMELRVGDKVVALRKLEALAQEEPWAPRAWTGLGEARLMQDEPDLAEARKALQRAAEREPYPAEALLRLAKLSDRRRRKDSEAIPKARELLEKAAEANPHLPRYREELALYLADIGFPQAAREKMKEVVDEPGVGWALPLRLARLEAAVEGPSYDPEPLLEKARERGAPADDITVLLARLDVDSGDRDRVAKAQLQLETLLQRDPENVEARVIYAQSFLRQFDRKAAESALRRGLAAVDDDHDGRLLYAWAELEARAAKTRLAAPRARRAWSEMLDEDRPPVELLDVADLAARLWLKINKERQALSVAQQLTDRLGYHSTAWIIRARTELAAGEAASARDSAQKAIELDPDNPRAHEINGHALLRYGLKDKAKEEYDRALELVKGTPLESEYRANFKRL
ncbi:MAG: hypothetical protein H6712_11645 [Myxococcales bacterium]|nr:hypothetical protein [Myxococcales bacterium]MCB9714507.1 hypothetical protein [Myxococcales bacterium]